MMKVILPFLLTFVLTVFLSIFTDAQQIKSYNVDQQIIKKGVPAGWLLAESRGYSFTVERHSKHIDKTQGIGIVPDKIVYPTIEGIRKHQDEVLQENL